MHYLRDNPAYFKLHFWCFFDIFIRFGMMNLFLLEQGGEYACKFVAVNSPLMRIYETCNRISKQRSKGTVPAACPMTYMKTRAGLALLSLTVVTMPT